MAISNNFEEQMFNYINNFVPKNKQVSWNQDAFFGIDFDATICDNDVANLEVDFATIASVIAIWKGEELDLSKFAKNKYLKSDEVKSIYARAKLFVPELSQEEKSRLEEVLARPNIMGDHLKNNAGKWPDNQEDYNKAMSGKPINALLKYIADEAKIYKDKERFYEFVDEKIVKRIEVHSISKIVPNVVKAPFEGWPETWNELDKSNIDYAIVTSSEYSRVIPLLRSANIGKYFGFTEKEYQDYDNLQKQLDEYEKDLDYNLEPKHPNDPYAEEIMAKKEQIFKLKADFHNKIKGNKNLHLYSAAEEEFRVNEENMRRKFDVIRSHKLKGDYDKDLNVDNEYQKAPEFKRKAAGDIYGLAILEEGKKRNKVYTFAVGIEDSGSIAAVKDARVFEGSKGYYGGDEAANKYDLAVGLVMASHYDVTKQSEKLSAGGADKVFCNITDVKNFIINSHKEAEAEKSLTAKDNQQALATALSKYGHRL